MATIGTEDYAFFVLDYFDLYVENLMLVINGRESVYNSILKFVRSIDLSSNGLSGSIPTEISSLYGLEFLNLSCNNLMGSIPVKMGRMKALESLDLSRNHLSEDEDFQGVDVIDENEDGSEIPWFYIGMGLGFIVGFWGVCGALLFKKAWRHAYFQFLYRVKDWVYVAIAIRLNRLQNNLRVPHM
ncbi:receptor-like protein EIX2 [Vitis riparia]|uniref:receptor-like protein EIX2 n=1 Tax=Vitis riparia TaxID=96939 RepID=UPI00155A828C|nr:receptor-like protein EIX2 [Vitis riparia]